MRELELARIAVREAGDILMRHWRRGVVARDKAAAGLVTDADLEAERTIIRFLEQNFPGHALLAEESQPSVTEAEHLWVVDPLDGTTNFAHRIPHFAVSVAYYRAGEAQCGIVWNPARGDWYEAARGGGAWHNGLQVSVTSETDLDRSLIGVGFYYDRGAMMEATLAAIAALFKRGIHGVRRFGTAALDLCQVGQGLYGGYFEYQLSPWDFAAGRLFVEEAGGKVTTCRGESLPLTRTHILASNGLLHPALQEIVQRHWPPANAPDGRTG